MLNWCNERLLACGSVLVNSNRRKTGSAIRKPTLSLLDCNATLAFRPPLSGNMRSAISMNEMDGVFLVDLRLGKSGSTHNHRLSFRIDPRGEWTDCRLIADNSSWRPGEVHAKRGALQCQCPLPSMESTAQAASHKRGTPYSRTYRPERRTGSGHWASKTRRTVDIHQGGSRLPVAPD